MMWKYVVLVATFIVLASTQQEQKTGCEEKNGRNVYIECLKQYHRNTFETLSEQQLAMRDYLKTNVCLRSKNVRITEIVEPDRYRLSTKLGEYSQDDVSIKILGNVLFLSFQDIQKFEAKIVILPRFVDTSRASYFIQSGSVYIVLPVDSATGVCDSGFGEDIRIVPVFEQIWGDVEKGKLVTSSGVTSAPPSTEHYVQEGASCESGPNQKFDIVACEQWWQEKFNVLSTGQKMLEDKLKEDCLSHSNARLRAVIGMRRFNLTAQLSGYTEDAFDIKIKGNVLYFSASSGTMFNTQLAIIPRFVKVTKAFYIYNGNTLDIVFPLNHVSPVCEYHFNRTTMTVPSFQSIKARSRH